VLTCPSLLQCYSVCYRSAWLLPAFTDAVEVKKMDYSAELYNESFDIGEESFQPDYYELDDESNSSSVVASSTGECVTGKKITIKKPGVEKLPVYVTHRRKRAWRSASRNETAASCVSRASTPAETATIMSSAAETTTVMSSSEESSTRPAVVYAQRSLTADEVLEGDG